MINKAVVFSSFFAFTVFFSPLSLEAQNLSRTSKKKPAAQSISKVCKSFSGVGFGVLWKPAADAGDARRGKPVVLFTGSKKPRSSAIKVYSSKGHTLCSFTFKSSSIQGVNKGADHYFSGWRGGCGKSASQLGSEARKLTGSSVIYFQGSGSACYGPANPTSRLGGI